MAHPRQLGAPLGDPTPQAPLTHRLADRLHRRAAYARTAVATVLPPPMLRPPGPTRLAQEVPWLCGGRPSSVVVLAVDALRLRGMACQSPGGTAARHGRPYLLRLGRPRALADRLLRTTRDGEVRRIPRPPPLAGRVQEESCPPRRAPRPLRRPVFAWRPGAVRSLPRRFPPPCTIEQPPGAGGGFPPCPHQPRMVNAVKGFDNLLPLSTTHSMTIQRS
jgi:hypothetical protein